MKVPADLVRMLTGLPSVGVAEQAFPFLTVDDAGFPHVALLSRAELDVTAESPEVLAVVASPRTRSNLERDGRACLIAVSGSTAHYAKLRVIDSIPTAGVLGCRLTVVDHKRDSAGVALSPIEFRPTAELARTEQWSASRELLRMLRERGRSSTSP